MSKNPAQHARTKHIDVRYHFIREHVQQEEVVPVYVKSSENVADVTTKGLDRFPFGSLVCKMGVGSVEQ